MRLAGIGSARHCGERMQSPSVNFWRAMLAAAAILMSCSNAVASEQAQFDMVCKGWFFVNAARVGAVRTTARVDFKSHRICFDECSGTPTMFSRKRNILSFSDQGAAGVLDVTGNHLSISSEGPEGRKRLEAGCSRSPFTGFSPSRP
jgi:hypothetical protein